MSTFNNNTSKNQDISLGENYILHQLHEPKLDLKIENNYLDSYVLRNNYQKKIVNLDNYNIINSNTVNSIYSSISNKVFNLSESTEEIQPVNFDKELQSIIYKKEQGNSYIKTNVDSAIKNYKEVLSDIEDCTRTLSDRDFEKSETLKKIYEQKKLIMSNLSLAYIKKEMYKESIDIDLNIIELDRKFEKSYGRLIQAYIKLDNIESANYYAKALKSLIGNICYERYKNQYNLLDIKNKKADERLNFLSKKSNLLKKESDLASEDRKSEINEDSESKLTKTNTNKFYYKVFNILIGTGIIAGSSIWLYYLYKNKSRFNR